MSRSSWSWASVGGFTGTVGGASVVGTGAPDRPALGPSELEQAARKAVAARPVVPAASRPRRLGVDSG
jgi:hypothetical protein